MFERLAEQRVAIYAVMHDATVTKAEHKHLDLKEDQWEPVPDGHCFQAFTDGYHCLQLQLRAKCILLHRVSCDQWTPLQPLVGAEGDLPAVQRFKRTVAKELERRFASSCLGTAKSLPVVCSAVDPGYAHLQFLSTEQREIAREELLAEWNLLRSKETRMAQTVMNHHLRGVRALRKTALCTFSWALSQRKNP